MKSVRRKSGATLIELMLATAMSVIAMGVILNAARFLQTLLSQQMRLERMSQALVLTEEIAHTVRSARRVLSVGPDHLELEVYNLAAYNLLDPLLYDQTKRVRYEVRRRGNAFYLSRDIYNSLLAENPESSVSFLTSAGLAEPTPSLPFFSANDLVDTSTVGVRVAIYLHPPNSKKPSKPLSAEEALKSFHGSGAQLFQVEEVWCPFQAEVYVQAE